MVKRKQKKKNSKWKITLFFMLVVASICFYIFQNGYKDIEINQLYNSGAIDKSIKQVVKDADRIKNEIVSQAENNIQPAIEKFKERSRERLNKENEVSVSQAPSLNLEIPIYTDNKDDGIILKRTGYTLSYNNYYKNPNWVAWELTREETKGKEDRYDKFLPDPDLPEPKVTHSDYTRSGYDRGHMAPAADFKWSDKAMKESFYMSNICPQTGNLNRGDWNDLEELCRKWANKYGTLYIACGPIFDKKNPKRIGNTKVAVPDRFFKVILIYNRKNPIAMGFIFQNISRSQDIRKYMVNVDSIEKETGMDFFSKLPDDVENRIESVIPDLPTSR